MNAPEAPETVLSPAVRASCRRKEIWIGTAQPPLRFKMGLTFAVSPNHACFMSIHGKNGRVMHWRRMGLLFALLAAVLIPLEQAHCALMPSRGVSTVAPAERQGGGDDHCCPESSSTPGPTPLADPLCCSLSMQLPPVTAPVTVTLAAPAPISTLFAILPSPALATSAILVLRNVAPEARSGPPPDPSSAPQSPRSPPYSA